MKFTKSQKVCFGLLAAGLSALAADRAFGGAGTPDLSAAAPDIDVPLAAETAVAPKAQAAASTLAECLRALVPTDGLPAAFPDAFAVPATWARLPGGRPVDAAGIAFIGSHALKAVMSGGQGGRALIGDRLVGVGETVDGFELVEVHERHAVFVADGKRVTLRLPDPTGTEH